MPVTTAPTHQPTSGAAMLAALSAGDEATWRATVTRYEGLLRFSARAVLRSHVDVDEAVQRTWVLLLRNAHRIEDPERLGGWLSTTARREALAILRGQQREAPSSDVGDRLSADEPDFAADLISAEVSRALEQAVAKLPESQRVVVRAMLAETRSYDALSRELGIPRGSLGPLRGRAVRALRAQLVPALA